MEEEQEEEEEEVVNKEEVEACCTDVTLPSGRRVLYGRAGADVSVDMDSGCNSVVVTGLTGSRGAGSVTVVTTSATVAAEVALIAANLNQCHEVFLFAFYEVIISYIDDKNV